MNVTCCRSITLKPALNFITKRCRPRVSHPARCYRYCRFIKRPNMSEQRRWASWRGVYIKVQKSESVLCGWVLLPLSTTGTTKMTESSDTSRYYLRSIFIVCSFVHREFVGVITSATNAR